MFFPISSVYRFSTVQNHAQYKGTAEPFGVIGLGVVSLTLDLPLLSETDLVNSKMVYHQRYLSIAQNQC